MLIQEQSRLSEFQNSNQDAATALVVQVEALKRENESVTLLVQRREYDVKQNDRLIQNLEESI
jgi:hypothetical protein